MSISYEVVSSDHGWGGNPSFATIPDAVRYVGPADYVVAVENGVLRGLTAEEELEFQVALGHDPDWPLPIMVAAYSESLRNFFRARFRAKACFSRRFSPGFR
jgi:hypothetical protein